MIATITALTGCNLEERKIQLAAVNENIEYAKKNFGKKEENACIDRFKTEMHDPASLQIAGKFYFDYASYGMAVFSVPIRARVPAGGLMKKLLSCHYMTDAQKQYIILSEVTEK
jgi:hypothetical protein